MPIKSDLDRIRIKPYAPVLKPIPIPAPGPFDPPTRCLVVNASWAGLIEGMMEAMDQPDAWIGTEPEIETARQNIREILAALNEGNCWTNPPEGQGVLLGKTTLYQDVRAGNTNGGSKGAGTEQHNLNTVIGWQEGMPTLTTPGSILVFSPGTYLIEARAQSFHTGRSRLALTKVNPYAGELCWGEDGFAGIETTSPTGITLHLSTIVTFAQEQQLILNQYAQIAQATFGFGISMANVNIDDVYATVKVTKFEDLTNMQGPPGPPGPPGLPGPVGPAGPQGEQGENAGRVVFRWTAGNLEYQHEGDAAWTWIGAKGPVILAAGTDPDLLYYKHLGDPAFSNIINPPGRVAFQRKPENIEILQFQHYFDEVLERGWTDIGAFPQRAEFRINDDVLEFRHTGTTMGWTQILDLCEKPKCGMEDFIPKPELENDPECELAAKGSAALRLVFDGAAELIAGSSNDWTLAAGLASLIAVYSGGTAIPAIAGLLAVAAGLSSVGPEEFLEYFNDAFWTDFKCLWMCHMKERGSRVYTESQWDSFWNGFILTRETSNWNLSWWQLIMGVIPYAQITTWANESPLTYWTCETCGCEPPPFDPNDYDWSHEYDFAVALSDWAISNGTWQPGTGITVTDPGNPGPLVRIDKQFGPAQQGRTIAYFKVECTEWPDQSSLTSQCWFALNGVCQLDDPELYGGQFIEWRNTDGGLTMGSYSAMEFDGGMIVPTAEHSRHVVKSIIVAGFGSDPFPSDPPVG